MQNKVLPQIFLHVKTYKTLLIKQLNSYIKYSEYNILFNNYTIQYNKKKYIHLTSFYKYFFHTLRTTIININ